MNQRQHLNKHFFVPFHNTVKRLNFYRGGGGSGKSHSFHQFVGLEQFLNGDHLEILVTRKTMRSLRMTAYRKIIDLLNDTIGVNSYYHKKTESFITYGTNMIQFAGLDDPEKIKSTEWDIIFAEELTDFTLEDFQMFDLRLKRSGNRKPRLFGAFNPVSAFHWLKTEYYDKADPYSYFHHSTYRDNKFCNKETRRKYRSLKDQNLTLWKIYSEGEWGSLESLIYSNYDIRDTFPEHFDEVIYGYDFGFSNPSAIVKIGILDTEFYIEEMLYETDLTSTKFVERLGSLGIDKNAQQFGDSNRADYIDEIYNAGYNIRGADKGAGSVIEGIDTVKRCKLHVLSSSLNLLKELRAYSFKKDKNDHIIDEPVKFNDHLADALRYAIYMYMQHSQPKVYLV
jgi:phage terminase large subunit